MGENFSRFHLKPGWIEVIVGCMFSGKTEELLTQIRRAQIARQKLQVFKPLIDDRYSEDKVASHNQQMAPSIPVSKATDILDRLERNTQVVGIDEAQFFDESIVEIASKIADAGKRVVIAGLDTDWQGKPFGPMPQLMAIAEVVRKQYAICMVCGDPATRTQRLIPASDNILVGSTEAYEARCRTHFDPLLVQRLKDKDFYHKESPLNT